MWDSTTLLHAQHMMRLAPIKLQLVLIIITYKIRILTNEGIQTSLTI